jgi:hypothetical protein
VLPTVRCLWVAGLCHVCLILPTPRLRRGEAVASSRLLAPEIIMQTIEHNRGKTPETRSEDKMRPAGTQSAKRPVQGGTPRTCSCCGSSFHRSGECPHIDVGDYAESSYNGL